MAAAGMISHNSWRPFHCHGHCHCHCHGHCHGQCHGYCHLLHHIQSSWFKCSFISSSDGAIRHNPNLAKLPSIKYLPVAPMPFLVSMTASMPLQNKRNNHKVEQKYSRLCHQLWTSKATQWNITVSIRHSVCCCITPRCRLYCICHPHWIPTIVFRIDVV